MQEYLIQFQIAIKNLELNFYVTTMMLVTIISYFDNFKILVTKCH